MNDIQALQTLAVGASLVNASGLFFVPQGGAYFFAILCSLALCGITFVRIVFVRPRDREDRVAT